LDATTHHIYKQKVRMILYHSLSARSFRPLWALEELGLKYELKILPFPPRVLDKSFLAINPLGTVPALVTEEGLMTESVAMCQYIADRHGNSRLTIASADPVYGAYLNWMFYGEATLTFPQTLVLRYGRFEPEERRNPQVAEDYKRWFLSRLKFLVPQISQHPYLCGERFTLADISVGYALMLAWYQGLELAFPPEVVTYWKTLQDRPAYQRALAMEAQAARDQGVSDLPSPLMQPA